MKLGHLFTRIITLLMGGFKDRCEPDPRPQLYIPLCCVLDVPVALHLGGWLLVICWPPRPEQIGIIPLLGSWRAAAAAVRHNFMRGLTARKIGMISQIISRRQQRSPRSVSLNTESRYGNPEVEHMSYLTYLNIYLRPGRAKCKANGPKCEKVALPK